MLSCLYEMSSWNLSRFCCILFWWDFLTRFHALLAVMRCPLWEFMSLVHNFCTRYPWWHFMLFWGLYELCVWDFMLVWPWCDFLMRFHAFWLPNIFFDGVIEGQWRGGCWRMREIEIECTRSYVWGWCNVTWTCSCDSRRFTRGLGWWSDVCNLKNVCLLWAVTVFWSGFFLLPSFLACWLWM